MITDAMLTIVRSLGVIISALLEIKDALDPTDDAVPEYLASVNENESIVDNTTTVKAVDAEDKVSARASPVKLADLRQLLSDMSAAGHSSEVRSLISSYGVTKLSDIKPEDYETIYETIKGGKYHE